MPTTPPEAIQTLRAALVSALGEGVPSSLRHIFLRAVVDLDGVRESSDPAETRLRVVRVETLLDVLRTLEGDKLH